MLSLSSEGAELPICVEGRFCLPVEGSCASRSQIPPRRDPELQAFPFAFFASLEEVIRTFCVTPRRGEIFDRIHRIVKIAGIIL